MDIFRRQKFNEAMFAKNRTLAIRVGQYQSSDIKEAHFDYGYIKGDTYKPGGTCAGSAKIVFTSIITTFNKLDKIYPEIGLLVDGTYEWVKMGEYFINDIEIDRNRKTTKLDLMDGMFKLNREYVTDLTYPAEIRHVIKEVCLKTGITLANEYMDITSMNYRIEQIPKNKKMTFRDVLSLASQMLGMSCFFNREGKLEIKELTDSGITITADSYFMHGLTKSEIEYQIAGISCKKDKETLTVGMRTGRSLELDNLFMSQTVLDNLYHKIKNIRYYPFNLNYQGHLLLNVGEWVTIKTNTGETFKSPVLSQSFTFKGGLRGRISADSKAGNDAQYSYAGTITKKIVQFNEFEAQIQNQIEEADNDFDQKVAKIKKDFNDQFELAKARAEEIKRQISDEIDKKFQSFDNAAINEARRKAEEALRSAGASSSLAQEAKQISERARADITNLQASSQNALSQIESFKNQYGTKLNEVKNTADGILTKLGTIETYINKDGQRQESLQRYARDESARQVSAVREQISRDYVGKSTYQEDVRGLERRFSAISTQTNNDIATKIAQYKQTVDGQFASITSQIAGKANQTDFQRVRETSQLYERIIGSNENDISNKVARMALTNQLFQVEVGKYSGNSVNRALNTTSNWGTFVSRSGNSGVNLHADLHKILSSGFKAGDTVHVRMEIGIDDVQRFNDKQIVAIIQSNGDVTNWAAEGRAFAYTIGTIQPGNNWRLIEFNTVMTEEMLRNNSWMLNLRVDGAKSYKVHTKSAKVEKGNVASAWSPAPEDTEEAVRTVQSQLAGSWAVQNLSSAGDLISGINLGANGHNRITGKLTHITGETLIDKAVIKSAMVDKLKTANFEAGSVTTVVLDAEAVTADKVRMDQAFAIKLVASNIFTDTLAAKEAFINKLRSVVVTATLLEGYKGRIGGFQIGTHEKDPNSYWLTGLNQFKVGMSNGQGRQFQTAFWANWGNDWGKPGPLSWYVTLEGKMFCKNDVAFHKIVDFSNTSTVNFYGSNSFHKNIEMKGGTEIYGTGRSPRENGKNAVVWWNQVGDGTVKYWIDKVSDRRLKRDIIDTDVNAINKINQLKMVAFDFIDSKKHEEIGLIAQDVEAVIPQAISQNPENPDGYLHIDYTAFVPYLIKAIQELNQKLEEIAWMKQSIS